MQSALGAMSTILVGVAGTVVIWMVSGVLAMSLGLVLAIGSLSRSLSIQWFTELCINLTRGIPTSVLVLLAGFTFMGFSPSPVFPGFYPGTPSVFQPLAWGLVIALAFGSAGHLATIFVAAYYSLGKARIEQANILGLSLLPCLFLLTRESAAVALAPTGSRLVHHLHNTAYVALFPVADLFGFMQKQANESFKVLDFVLLACLIYAGLSLAIWLGFRVLEAQLAPPKNSGD
jgi:ABC-type amino acid transport system permease subunit